MNKPQISAIGRKTAKFLASLLLLPAVGAVPTGAGFAILLQRREEEAALEAPEEVVETVSEAPEAEAAPAAEGEEDRDGEDAPDSATPASKEPSSSSAFAAALSTPAVRGSRRGSHRGRGRSNLLPWAAGLLVFLALAGAAEAVNESNITSWSNNVTNDAVLSISVVNGTTVRFNATANQSGNWTWRVNGTAEKSTTINATTDDFNFTFNNTTLPATRIVNASVTNSNGTSQNVSWTVTITAPVYPPNITSWGNNVTSDSSLSLTVDIDQGIRFNATANQSGTFTWKRDGVADQNNTSTTTAYYNTSFSTSGEHYVTVNVSNSNGTSLDVNWTVTVNAAPPPPNPYTVWGRIFNETGVAVGNGSNVSVTVTNATTQNGTCNLNATTADDGSYTTDLSDCGSGKYYRGDNLMVNVTNTTRGAYGEGTGTVSTNTSVNDTAINFTWSLNPLWRKPSQNLSTVGYQQEINLSAQGIDGRNLTTAILFTNETGGWAPSRSLVGANTTHNFSSVDTGDWIGANSVNALAYDSANGTVYIGTDAGKFGVYNNSTHVATDRSGAASWLGTTNINALAYDPDSKRVYIGADSGVFGVYDVTANNSTNLSTTDPGNWMGTTSIRALAYDSARKEVYIGLASGKFGVYNRTENQTWNLTSTGNWFGTGFINSLAYDSARQLVYIGADVTGGGGFGVYNNTTNMATNLSDTLSNILGTYSTAALAYDSAQQVVYIGTVSGNFAVYNNSTNTTTDLSNTDGGNWIGVNTVRSLAYDSASRLIFMGAGGQFGVYSSKTNLATNLSETDPGDWMGTNTIASVAYDSANYLVYVGTLGGKFGAYDATARYSFALPNDADWLWSNFTWRGDTVPSGTYVGWYINYTDADEYYNNTSVLTFRVVPAITNWTNNNTSSSALNLSVELGTVVSFTVYGSETVNWTWSMNGTTAQGPSNPAVSTESFIREFNVTGNHSVEVFGNNSSTGLTRTLKWAIQVNDTKSPTVNASTAQLSPSEVVRGTGVELNITVNDTGNVTAVVFGLNGTVTATPNESQYINISASLASGTSKNGTWNATFSTAGLKTGFYNWTNVSARDSTGNWNNATQNATAINIKFWVVTQQTITLYSGRNLVALPMDRVPIDGSPPTAEQTCGTGPFYMISDFKRAAQSWQSHVCGILANNYNLATRKGFWASTTSAAANITNITGQGFELPGGVQTLEPKWNLVGPRNQTWAQNVCDAIGSNATAVSRLNTTTNSYETHLCGLAANNFTMNNNTGYWIYSNNQANWTQ